MKSNIQTATGIVVGILGLFSAGCANQPTVPALPETAYTAIATDAAKQLATLYPPAKTYFVLNPSSSLFYEKWSIFTRYKA